MANMKLKGFTFVQVPLWLLACSNVDPQAKVIYGYLVWRQGRNAGCWPSLDKIAADLQLSRASVMRHLRRLEQLGYIQVTREKGRANLYTVNGEPGQTVKISESLRQELGRPAEGDTPAAPVPPVAAVTPTRITHDTPPVSAVTPTRVSDDTPPVAAVAPDPYHPCNPNHIQEPEKGTRDRERDTVVQNFHLNRGPPRPPAVQLYSEMTRIYYPPDSLQWQAIDATVDGNPQALERWRETVAAWINCGNSSRNVQGMLDWFKSGKRDNRWRAPEAANGSGANNAEAAARVKRDLERWEMQNLPWRGQ